MAWITDDKRAAELVTQPESVVSQAVRDKIEALAPRYETRQSLLLPALHAVQHEIGYLPVQAVVELAEILSLSPAEVQDTISFYEEYFTEPKGKHMVMVCRSLSCELMGCEGILAAIKKKLGVSVNRQSTADGKFTFMEVECLAACDKAPCMMINAELHENLTASDAAAQIDRVNEE